MKLSELLSELKEKDSYKTFKTENPDAFFCSSMVVLGEGDRACPNQIKPQTCEGEIDLNFFIPNERIACPNQIEPKISEGKISSFSMPFSSITNHQEEIKDQEEIKNLDFKVDIDNLKEFAEEKTQKKFTKIIAVLQKNNWNLTCLNGLDMSRMNIDAYTGEIEKKDEGSLMDMVRFTKGNKS